MRIPYLCVSALGAICLVACATAPASAPSAGVSGAPLASTLSVHVVDELTGDPFVGASVDVGAAVAMTDAHGDATLSTTTSSVTLRVSAPGQITEQWIGVDRDHVVVGLATPIVPRTLTGAIALTSGDTVVSAATTVSVLRTSSLIGSTGACIGGACEVTLTVETRTADLHAVVVDAASARIDASPVVDGRFAIHESDLTAGSARLVTLEVTIPSAPSLQGVVGVPGLATADGVALFPSFTPSATSVLVPAREGPFADARLWYVVRGTNVDGSGESVLLDRDLGAGTTVELPSAFLAIPSATASGTVGIDVDPAVDLYVIEAFSGANVEHTLVLHPSGAHVDVPVALAGASRVVVRAIDAALTGDGIDLAAAERTATRIATLEL